MLVYYSANVNPTVFEPITDFSKMSRCTLLIELELYFFKKNDFDLYLF